VPEARSLEAVASAAWHWEEEATRVALAEVALVASAFLLEVQAASVVRMRCLAKEACVRMSLVKCVSCRVCHAA